VLGVLEKQSDMQAKYQKTNKKYLPTLEFYSFATKLYITKRKILGILRRPQW